LNTISLSSNWAFTAGHSCKAIQEAFEKKDMKPRLVLCFSLKSSLYIFLRSMIGCILTSLKVVSMAVSFFTLTSRRATVRRRDDILSLRDSLHPPTLGAYPAGGL